MDKPIRGLHHVTATVGDAQPDLDFYAGVLGQRLVKKTVNFDNHLVYHFYYGNESGTPGTIMTTFPLQADGRARRDPRRRADHGHVVLGSRRVASVLAQAADRCGVDGYRRALGLR